MYLEYLHHLGPNKEFEAVVPHARPPPGGVTTTYLGHVFIVVRVRRSRGAPVGSQVPSYSETLSLARI